MRGKEVGCSATDLTMQIRARKETTVVDTLPAPEELDLPLLF